MYIAITDFYDPIGSKELTNRCPDCGASNSLELILYQKRIETSFSTKITNKVTGMLYCHKTKSEISPVQWNEEIERIFNTEKQKVRLQPKSTKFNKWFYGLITFLIALTCFCVGYFMIEANATKNLEEGLHTISVGDKIEVLYTNANVSEPVSVSNTWFLVKKIEGDTVWLQRHKKIDQERSASFELDDSNFTKEVLQASLKSIQDRSLMSHDYSSQSFTGFITNIKE